jgi:hypothetical protein
MADPTSQCAFGCFILRQFAEDLLLLRLGDGQLGRELGIAALCPLQLGLGLVPNLTGLTELDLGAFDLNRSVYESISCTVETLSQLSDL